MRNRSGNRSLASFPFYAVRAVLVEIILHRGGDTADADCGDNTRRAADVAQFKTGDVLTLAAEIVRRAWTSPVVAGIVGKIKSGLGAGDDVVAVVWIYSHFAHRVVLRKLTDRFSERRSENVRA